MFEPNPGHQTPVAERVEFFVIQLRDRLKIQHHHRYANVLHHRQNCRTERIGRDVEKNKFDFFPAK